jgi:hypothetical protein
MTDKRSAELLRRYTAESNRLHRQYLGDAKSLAAYRRFIGLQLGYFLPKYDDLRDRPGYDAAIDFIISDLVGPGIADRDRDLERVVPVMSRMLPAKALRALALAMELNARILGINLGIESALREKIAAGDGITERDYCLATRGATNFDEFKELIGMTREAGLSLEHIVGMPMIRPMLRAMRGPARLAGFADLQAFLEKGFQTFIALDDVHTFLDVMEARMTEVFRRVFEADEATLDTAPIAPH